MRDERTRWGPPMVLVVGLAVTLMLPTAAADPLLQGCDRGVGTQIQGGTYVCVEYSVDFPDEIFDHVPPSTPDAETEACPEDSNGTIVVLGETKAGYCFKVLFKVPQSPLSTGNEISLGPECEIGDEPAQDPKIDFGDGGVGYCHQPVLMIGNQTVPGFDYSLEPCSRNPDESVDPEVRILGGGVYICVRYGL